MKLLGDPMEPPRTPIRLTETFMRLLGDPMGPPIRPSEAFMRLLGDPMGSPKTRVAKSKFQKPGDFY